MIQIIGAADILRSRLLRFIGLAKYHLLERQFTHTLRIGMVISTLLLTLISTILIAQLGLLGLVVVGAIAGLCALVFIYNFFTYAVLALMLTTTVLAPNIPRDITTTLILLIVLTLVWMTRIFVVDRSFQSLRPAPANRFIPLFILTVVISFIWSMYYADPFIIVLQNDKMLPRLVTGLVMILSPIGALLFANFIRSVLEMKWIVWYYMVFGAAMLAFKFLQTNHPGFLNSGGQLPVWVSIFAAGQIFFNRALLWWQRVGLLAIIGGWVYISFFVGRTWLSGWVPLFLGVGIVILLRSRVLFAGLAIIGLIYVVINLDDFDSLIADENTESGETRLEAGSFTLDVANQHFLFGTGPTGYYFYMQYYLVDWFQLSHNNYVDVYAQTGIIGFASFVLMWLSFGWSAWKTWLRIPKDGFERGLAASLVGIFVVTMTIMMLGDWVTPFTYTQTMRGLSYTIWPWLWAGMAIALGHIVRQEQASQSQATLQSSTQG